MNVYFRNGSSFTSIFDLVYPVGSYWITNGTTAPNNYFGGTWTRLDDYMLLGHSSNRTSNGSSWSVTLTTSNMPSHTHTGTTGSSGSHTHSTTSAGSHTHTVSIHRDTTGNGLTWTGTASSPTAYARGTILKSDSSNSSNYSLTSSSNGSHSHTANSAGSHTHSFTTGSAGSGTSFNIAGKYRYCGIYYRTA